MSFVRSARVFASHLTAITRGESVSGFMNTNAPTSPTPMKMIVCATKSGEKGKVLKRMKKALMYWISKDKSSAGSPVWVDVPETERDRAELDARKERLMNNPIALKELEALKSLGFRWIHSASDNQFDGHQSDNEYEDCTVEVTDGN